MLLITIGLLLILSVTIGASNNPKYVHEYKRSLAAPFYYPPDSKDIPSYSYSGDVEFVKRENALRLSSEVPKSSGGLWLDTPIPSNWRTVIHFRIHSDSRSGGDGLALWLVKDKLRSGEVFGMQNNWNGLGIFLDSFPSPNVKLVENDGRSSYRMHDPAANPINSKHFDFTSLLKSVLLRVTYVDKKLTIEIDRTSYGRNYQLMMQRDNFEISDGSFLGVSASSVNNGQNHDISKIDFYSVVYDAADEIELKKEDKGKHDFIRTKLEELMHKKEEKKHYDPIKTDATIINLLEKIEEFQENVSDYLHLTIGNVKGGKNLSQRLNDVEERIKTFTDHVNLLTTALNKLTGAQSDEKGNIHQILQEFKETTEKKFAEIEGHASTASSSTQNIHRAVESSASLQGYLFYGLIFLSQIVLVIAYSYYKKTADYNKKLF